MMTECPHPQEGQSVSMREGVKEEYEKGIGENEIGRRRLSVLGSIMTLRTEDDE